MSRAEVKGKVTPEVLQAALLDEIASRLANVQELLQRQTSEGIFENVRDVSVTNEGEEVKVPHAWRSFTLHNDGRNTVGVAVNTKQPPLRPVRPGGDYNVDAKVDVIHFIFLRTNPGETARVQITGIR